MTNARPRTRNRYSRRATWRAFGKRSLTPHASRLGAREVLLRLVDGATADVLDEDLLQAGLGDLEARHALAALERRAQDRGRVAVGRHVELDVVLALGRHAHARQLRQPVDAVAVALGGEPHDLAAHGALHVSDGAADHDPAAVDDGDRLAQLLDRLHLVGAEDERLAAVAHLEEGFLEQAHVDRIEPGERLVHDQHLGVVEDRRDELDLLLVALRQLLDLALAVVGDAEPLEPVVDLGPARRRREPRRAPRRSEAARRPSSSGRARAPPAGSPRFGGGARCSRCPARSRGRHRRAGCRARSACSSSCRRRSRRAGRRCARARR